MITKELLALTILLVAAKPATTTDWPTTYPPTTYPPTTYPPTTYPPTTYPPSTRGYPTTTRRYPTTSRWYPSTTRRYPTATTTRRYTTTSRRYPTTSRWYPSTTRRYPTTSRRYPTATTTRRYPTTSRWYPSTTRRYPTTSRRYPTATTTRRYPTTSRWYPTTTRYPPWSTTTRYPPWSTTTRYPPWSTTTRYPPWYTTSTASSRMPVTTGTSPPPWSTPGSTTWYTTIGPLQNECKSYATGQCLEKNDTHLLAEFKFFYAGECTRICQEDYAGHCKSITYNNNETVCSLWSLTGVEYREACGVHFGSSDDQNADMCIDYSQHDRLNGQCAAYRYADCSVTNPMNTWIRPKPIGVLKDLPDEYACHSACWHDNWPCRHYEYEASSKTCKFYGVDTSIKCNLIMGPPEDNNNVQQCVDMIMN